MSVSKGYSKKLASALLLGMFLFIQAEKIFHTHPKTPAGAKMAVTLKPVNAFCSICEFQLARDAQVPALVITNLPCKDVKRDFAFFLSPFFPAPSLRVALRGPPVNEL